ncbi:MAG: OmpA family protein [Luteimonas sp.]
MSSKPWLAAVAAAFVTLATACSTTPEPPPPPEQDMQPLPSTFLERLSADGLFAFGKSGIDDLSDEGRVALDDLAARLVERPVEIVHVIGHSDRIGTPTAIHRVSSERANAVRDYLIERGVQEGLITAVGRGSVEPVVECDGGSSQEAIDCLAPNRRVEVRVQFAD